MFKPIACLVFCALAAVADTAAADYWASCSGCGSRAKNFAIGVPPDQRGTSRVHVYDRADGNIRSFAVEVTFEPELRGFTRFAWSIPTPQAARDEVDAVLGAVAELEAVAGSLGPVDAEIDSVQEYLANYGMHAAHVRHVALESLQLDGVFDRIYNGLVTLAAAIADIVVDDPPDVHIEIFFRDGSSIKIKPVVNLGNLFEPDIEPVPDTARLPDGTFLPETSDDVNGLVLGTNSAETANAVSAWIREITSHSIRMQQTRQSTYRYTFRCTNNECVILVRVDSNEQ